MSVLSRRSCNPFGKPGPRQSLRFFFSWGLTLTAASIGGAVAFSQPTHLCMAVIGSKCHPFIWVSSECRAGDFLLSVDPVDAVRWVELYQKENARSSKSSEKPTKIVNEKVTP